MRSTILLLLLGFVLLIQSTVMDLLSIAGIKPDLVMLIVVSNGFLRGTREGSFFGIIAGLLVDLLTGNYIGHYMLTMMFAGYLAGWFGSRFYKENPGIVLGTVFLCSLAGQLLYYVLLLFLGVYVTPLHALFFVMLPTATYNTLLTPLLYGLFHRSSSRGLLNEKGF
ncbi:MAG TPA: rod shape-determining protein MreD [Clostridia bacterium]|nr:rod shape-determining protein MreD [Clostridia bacterium]